MIRPFDWRDVRLVRRLAEQGVCLNAETCFIRGWHSLPSALLSYVSPGASLATFVWHGRENNHGAAAFGQMLHRPGDERAHLLFLAPRPGPHPDDGSRGSIWEDLIESLVTEAGERGAHNLLADVGGDTEEFDALRRLGFAIYGRQSIWRQAGPPPAGANGRAPVLRRQQSADAWGIQILYSNVVPRLVQQVESPPPPHGRRGYVLEEDGEIMAFLRVARGPLGVWCEPYLHPQAFGRSAEVIHSFLRLAGQENSKNGRRPVYFCVKSYQDWLHAPLAAAGFAPAGEQAVMVKRLAVRLVEVEPSLVAVLENTRAKVTTPLVKSTRRAPPPASGLRGRLTPLESMR